MNPVKLMPYSTFSDYVMKNNCHIPVQIEVKTDQEVEETGLLPGLWHGCEAISPTGTVYLIPVPWMVDNQQKHVAVGTGQQSVPPVLAEQPSFAPDADDDKVDKQLIIKMGNDLSKLIDRAHSKYLKQTGDIKCTRSSFIRNILSNECYKIMDN